MCKIGVLSIHKLLHFQSVELVGSDCISKEIRNFYLHTPGSSLASLINGLHRQETIPELWKFAEVALLLKPVLYTCD